MYELTYVHLPGIYFTKSRKGVKLSVLWQKCNAVFPFSWISIAITAFL